MAALITQADLEERFSALAVRRVFTDDGSNTPGPRLALALDAASSEAVAILGLAWPSVESREALVTNDAAVKGALCVIAMALGYQSRPEFMLADGSWPYDKPAVAARKVLRDITQAELRPKSEAQAGANPVHTTRYTEESPAFIFAPSGGTRPGGGF